MRILLIIRLIGFITYTLIIATSIIYLVYTYTILKVY